MEKVVKRKNPFQTDPISEKKPREDFPETKQNEWGKGKKFNPETSRRLQPATPWIELKNDMLNQKTEAFKLKNHSEENSDKNDAETKKKIILSKQNEETTWEKFPLEQEASIKSFKTDKKTHKKNKSNNKQNNVHKKTEFPVIQKNGEFDKLTASQNNLFKKIITKTTRLCCSTSLKSAVVDLKYRGLERKRKEK